MVLTFLNIDFKNSPLKVDVTKCETRAEVQAAPMSKSGFTAFVIMAIISCFVIITTIIELIVITLYTKKQQQEAVEAARNNELGWLRAKLVRLYKLNTCFSLITNVHELSTPTRGKFTCIDGIKALSMVWIVYTHTYLVPIKESYEMACQYMDTVGLPAFQLIANGWVLVDTFFVVAAALAVNSMLKSLAKSRGRISFLWQYANRVARLSPVLWASLGGIFLMSHVSVLYFLWMFNCVLYSLEVDLCGMSTGNHN